MFKNFFGTTIIQHARLAENSNSIANFGFGYMENTHLQNSLTYPNGMVKTITYEPNRDLIKDIEYSRTYIIDKYSYTNDLLKRHTTMNLSNGYQTNTKEYSYNSRSEVILVENSNGKNEGTYAYDNIGNRTYAKEPNYFELNYTSNNLNQYVFRSSTVWQESWDADGNQTSLHAHYFPEIKYNGENRPIYFNWGNNWEYEMKYDYMGRRVESVKRDYNTKAVLSHQKFVYDGYTLIQELDGNNFMEKEFVWDPTAGAATRPLVYRKNIQNLYYIHDANKNVRALIGPNFIKCYDYSPFGEQEEINNSDVTGYEKIVNGNPFGFSSEYHDKDLRLIYYNYRHYNPHDGRWLSRDPIEEQGGWNLYGMVKNNIINKVDLLGQTSCPPCTQQPSSLCKWSGSVSMGTTGIILGTYSYYALGAFGVDLNNKCSYGVSGSGYSWFKSAGLFAGYLEVSFSFNDIIAPCQWPLKKGDIAVFSFSGITVSLGGRVRVNVHAAAFQTGSFTQNFGYGANILLNFGNSSISGPNVSIAGAISAFNDEVIRVGPSSVGQ